MCKNEAETTALTPEQKLYQERLNRVETAIHLGTKYRYLHSFLLIFREPMAPAMRISIMILTKPGRPGTKVSPFSSHQIIERELMLQEEYPEMLNDFTGFMLRKYIPRAYQNLSGTAGLRLSWSEVDAYNRAEYHLSVLLL